MPRFELHKRPMLAKCTVEKQAERLGGPERDASARGRQASLVPPVETAARKGRAHPQASSTYLRNWVLARARFDRCVQKK